ncbi:hypothetical protein ACE3MQ_05840 [Paenibacillus lentus]|uniref:hypothetical protein n=1 Tax=Paenibacillus lentus TaxID=1338368 RepID=UPI00365D2392
MKLKLKIISYVMASLILVIIGIFFFRSFFDVLNSGMEVRLPHLGMTFQLTKISFIILNLLGFIICLILIVKNHRILNKAFIGLAMLNFLYALISFLWVAIAYQITEEPQEQLLNYVINTILGKSQEGLITWDSVGIIAPLHYIRSLYMFNLYNAFTMLVLALILIVIKQITDKKLNKM